MANRANVRLIQSLAEKALAAKTGAEARQHLNEIAWIIAREDWGSTAQQTLMDAAKKAGLQPYYYPGAIRVVLP